MKNTKIAVAAAAAVCALAVSGCSAGGNTTVMEIGSDKIKANEVAFFAAEIMGASDFDAAKEDVAERVADAYKAKAVALASGISLDEEDEEDVRMSLVNIRQGMGGKKAFDALIKEYNIGEGFIKDMIAQTMYEEKLEEKLEAADPTDEEIRQELLDKYLRAKHVLITCDDTMSDEEKAQAQTKANDVLARAQSGADFDSLITEFNEDPGMKSNPDGYVFTDGDMVEEFEEATKALLPGGIGMCKTDYGYHIILRLAIDETPEKLAEILEDNKSDISRSMKETRREEAMDKLAESLNVKINIKEDAIKNIKQPEISRQEA